MHRQSSLYVTIVTLRQTEMEVVNLLFTMVLPLKIVIFSFQISFPDSTLVINEVNQRLGAHHVEASTLPQCREVAHRPTVCEAEGISWRPRIDVPELPSRAAAWIFVQTGHGLSHMSGNPWGSPGCNLGNWELSIWASNPNETVQTSFLRAILTYY